MKHLRKFNESISYDSVEIEKGQESSLEYLISEVEQACKEKVINVTGKYDEAEIDLSLNLDNGDSISISYDWAPYSGYSEIAGRMMNSIEVEYKASDKIIKKTDNDIEAEEGREIYSVLKAIIDELYEEELDWPYYIRLPRNVYDGPKFDYDIDSETYGSTDITVVFDSEEQAQQWIKSLKIKKEN